MLIFSEGRVALICGVRRFLWCAYSYHGWFEALTACHWVSCWEELCRIGCLKPECTDSHTTGRTARLFLVAGSKTLKLISSNKTCQGWVTMFWLIQQFSVIITDPHSFCLSVLSPAVCYSCPHASVHYGWKMALIVPCIQTWQLPEEKKDCPFPLCHSKRKETHPMRLSW